MFTFLPLPVRPFRNPNLPVFWLGVTAVTLALVCLLHRGQPHASAPSHAENPPPGQFFQQAFIRAVPEVGLMSEVRTSGPYLRAVAAAWPGDSTAPAVQDSGTANTSIPHKKTEHESLHPTFGSPQRQVFPQPVDAAAPSSLIPGGIPAPAHDTQASTAKPGVVLALRNFFQNIAVREMAVTASPAHTLSRTDDGAALPSLYRSRWLNKAILTDSGAGVSPDTMRIGSQAPGKSLEQRIGNGLGLGAFMPQSLPWQEMSHSDANADFAFGASWRLDLPAEFWCAPYLRGQYYSFSQESRRSGEKQQYFLSQGGVQAGWSWRTAGGDSFSVYGGAGISQGTGIARFFRERGERDDTRFDFSLGITVRHSDKLSLNLAGEYSGGSTPGWRSVIGLRYDF